VAEGARLESVYTETYRGFESLSHRQFLPKKSLRPHYQRAHHCCKIVLVLNSKLEKRVDHAFTQDFGSIYFLNRRKL
jgi:hypothetical protein